MKYSSQQFVLNKLCEFTNPDVESDFLEYEKQNSLNIIRVLILLMGFTFALFIISDYVYFGQESSFFISIGLRSAGLLITVAAFKLAGIFKSYQNTLNMISVMQLMVFTVYLLNLLNQRTTDPSLQFMAMILLIISAFFIPNRWKNCILVALIMLVAYTVFCTAFRTSMVSPSLLQQVIYLGICLITCSIFIYGRESSRRKQFVAEKLLEYVSTTDKLTGIYNRGHFEHILGAWIKNKRHNPLCLLFFDIDNFKSVNDRFGHHIGDMVLTLITEAVSAVIRDDDIFARWGGEEFVILFGSIDIKKAMELAERARKAVEEKQYGNAQTVTISIGVVQHREGESAVDFIKRADEKMYQAKKAGKNQVAGGL